MRGASVMAAYYGTEEQASVDEGQWLHTGDVGEWLANGALKVVDRKEQIVPLRTGDKVAPRVVEQVYRDCPFVHQVTLKLKPLHP